MQELGSCINCFLSQILSGTGRCPSAAHAHCGGRKGLEAFRIDKLTAPLAKAIGASFNPAYRRLDLLQHFFEVAFERKIFGLLKDFACLIPNIVTRLRVVLGERLMVANFIFDALIFSF